MSSKGQQLLSYPRRDILDKLGYEKQDNAVPKVNLPAWKRMPLDCKIPAVWRTHHPVILTRTALGEPLLHEYRSKEFDLSDPFQKRMPTSHDPHLHDPNLKEFLSRPDKFRHLVKTGLLTSDGRITCSLKEFNEYRAYLREVLVQEYHQDLREQARREQMEAERAERRRNAEARRVRERIAGAHSWIKAEWAAVRERSMQVQREKDARVINKEIRTRLERKEKELRYQDKHGSKFEAHVSRKYKSDKNPKKERLRYLEEDIRRLDALIEKQRLRELQKQIKHDEWWQRKAACQQAWMDKEKELLSDMKSGLSMEERKIFRQEPEVAAERLSETPNENATYLSEYTVTLKPAAGKDETTANDEEKVENETSEESAIPPDSNNEMESGPSIEPRENIRQEPKVAAERLSETPNENATYLSEYTVTLKPAAGKDETSAPADQADDEEKVENETSEESANPPDSNPSE